MAVVREPLARGAAVDAADVDGVTPLFSACEGGHLEVVRELLAWGAAADAADEDGTTPLRIARHEGHWEVVRELELHARGAADA